jgi:hypothetical protein
LKNIIKKTKGKGKEKKNHVLIYIYIYEETLYQSIVFYEENYTVFPHVLIFLIIRLERLRVIIFTVEYKKRSFFLILFSKYL